MSVQYISDPSVFEAALSKAGSKLVVVDFYAEWCGPCHQIAPHFYRLSTEYKERAMFIKVEADEGPELVDTYNISSLPTFVFLRSGAELDRFTGTNVTELESKLANLTESSPSQLSMTKKTEAASKSEPSTVSNLMSMFGSRAGQQKDRNFQGEGHRLGDASSNPKPEASSGAASTSLENKEKGWFSAISAWFPSSSGQTGSEEKAQAQLGVDEKLPHAPVSIRLINSKKVKVMLNLTHPVSKIREFILISRPEFAKCKFVLINSITRTEITDETVTIQDANLANCLLIQKLSK